MSSSLETTGAHDGKPSAENEKDQAGKRHYKPSNRSVLQRAKSLMSEDHLDTDPPIANQNYVVLSFLFPEDLIQEKHIYFLSVFWKSLKKSSHFESLEKLKNLDFIDVFDNYVSQNREKLEEKFYSLSGGLATIRGIKVRGVFNTMEEAVARTKELQAIDKNFHMNICSVGAWLPFEVHVSNLVEDQVFQEQRLNALMQDYKLHREKRDAFYKQETAERINAAKKNGKKGAEESAATA